MKLAILDFMITNFYNLNDNKKACYTVNEWESDFPKECDSLIKEFRVKCKRNIFDKTNPFDFDCDFDKSDGLRDYMPSKIIEVNLLGEKKSKLKSAIVEELNLVLKQIYFYNKIQIRSTLSYIIKKIL